jgi:predicted permease
LGLVGILIDVVGPVLIVAAIGYVWALRGPKFESGFVTVLVNNIATPALILDSLLNAKLHPSALGTMALGASLSMGLMLLLGWVFVRVQGLSVSTFLPTLVWSNGGNMGLPLMLFAFGEQGLALAIGWFAFSAITNYTLGQAIAAGGMSFRQLTRLPIVWALAVVLLVMFSGLRPPEMFMRTSHLLAGISVPLMLMSLGYSLANLHVGALPRSLLFSCARLFGGFAIGWGVATLLGLDGVQRGVLVIQSAMPSAVLNYLFASRYGNQASDVAGIVVLSTLMSIFLLPIFLTTVM